MIKGTQLRDAFISGANSISNCKQQVDALNVFPVPDGDTGTNMSMTINAAKRELETLRDDPTVEQVAKKAASALLRGARGNSGVILSLLFRGFSKGLGGQGGGRCKGHCKRIVDGCHRRVQSSYEADGRHHPDCSKTGRRARTAAGSAGRAADRSTDVERNPGQRAGCSGTDTGDAAGAQKSRRSRCGRTGLCRSLEGDAVGHRGRRDCCLPGGTAGSSEGKEGTRRGSRIPNEDGHPLLLLHRVHHQ